MPLFDCPAPAKLNLFLRVTGRRSDGYHELQSLFTLIDLEDRLDFIERQDERIVRSGDLAELGPGHDLCWRAAELLRRRAGLNLGVEIVLRKRIPLGAGLGGGSSDAATVLVALNQLWGLAWPRARLAELGLELGADVPFFVHGVTALVTGIGEILTPYPIPTHWYLVVYPGVAVSTREIFGDPQLTRDSIPVKMRDFSMGSVGNNLQAVAMRRHPEIADVIDWLNRHAPAQMTGSGSGCFAIFTSRAVAQGVGDQLPAEWSGFVVQGVACHPLNGVL